MAKANRSVLRGEHPGTVLLVDDDPAVLKCLATSIQSSLFKVAPCLTPHEAVAHIAHDHVLAVVSDIAMPEMSGIELLRMIRQYDPDLPVVLVTGDPSIRSATEAVEFGAFMYLVKPVDPVILTMTIERAIRQYFNARLNRETLVQLGAGEETANLARLQAQYEHALDALWIAYQPIVRAADGSVFGHEALLRCDGSLLQEPEQILNAAERLNVLHKLGRIVRELAVKPFLSNRDWTTLFVNLHPHDLEDADLRDGDSSLASISERVVLEITERAALLDIVGFRQKLDALREIGFRIAVDDLGAGYAGLNSVALLEPEFIKLDMTLVRKIDEEPVKQKLVASLIALGSDMGYQVIAEGVETCAERDTLIELGCDMLQGYLISRPEREFAAANWLQNPSVQMVPNARNVGYEAKLRSR